MLSWSSLSCGEKISTPSVCDTQAFTQQVCMDRIFSIVASNSANYLCTVSTLIFQVFVERMESFELESQVGTPKTKTCVPVYVHMSMYIQLRAWCG